MGQSGIIQAGFGRKGSAMIEHIAKDLVIMTVFVTALMTIAYCAMAACGC